VKTKHADFLFGFLEEGTKKKSKCVYAAHLPNATALDLENRLQKKDRIEIEMNMLVPEYESRNNKMKGVAFVRQAVQ
jgi:hypothetical protein